MLDIMYEIPKDDNIGQVRITREYIEHTGGPVIIMRACRDCRDDGTVKCLWKHVTVGNLGAKVDRNSQRCYF